MYGFDPVYPPTVCVREIVPPLLGTKEWPLSIFVWITPTGTLVSTAWVYSPVVPCLPEDALLSSFLLFFFSNLSLDKAASALPVTMAFFVSGSDERFLFAFLLLLIQNDRCPSELSEST